MILEIVLARPSIHERREVGECVPAAVGARGAGALTGSRDGESLFDFRALDALSASVRDERGPHASNTRRKRAGGTGEARIAR